MREKNADLELLAKKLDISPTMYQYAVDRYKGLTKYLISKDIEVSLYLQGSFRTGTVVRPIKDGEETDYDIDIVCEINKNKNEITPQDLKKMIGSYLKENEIYKEKLLREDSKCWTLQYAGVDNGIGFQLDIVPCVKENSDFIVPLVVKGVSSEYAKHSIAITKKEGEQYKWISSNPKGYAKWFDEINEPFQQSNIKERKQRILNENRVLFGEEATIEDVPNDMLRSSLQIVIQLLKRHRDIYYERKRIKKPISAIITTLVAKIAKDSNKRNVDELLTEVVTGLKKYSSLLNNNTDAPLSGVGGFIERSDKGWRITNPVNYHDNYADSWNDDVAKVFFEWVDVVYNDLVEPNTINESQYINGLMTSFGAKYVKNCLDIDDTLGIKKIETTVKPWRK